MQKNKTNGRKILESALLNCCSDYCDQFPPYEGKIELGDDYENHLRHLCEYPRNPFQKHFNTIGKRVAGIAIAVSLLFSISMTVSATRESVAEFFTNIHEKFIEIFFDKNDISKAPSTIETVYTLGYVPNGYNSEKIFIGITSTDISWVDEYGNRISFCQSIISSSVILDDEKTDYHVIEQNEQKIAFVQKYDIKVFYWSSNEYEFLLTVSDDISQEEALALIDSIVKYNF